MQYQLLVVAALASSALATNGQGAAHIVMSPEAAKDAEDEMRAALQEEAPLLKEVRAEPKSSRQHKSEEFEKDVTDMIMGLSKADFGATPMGSSVTVIKDLIEKDMLGRVIKAHASNQDDLNKASAQTKACGTTKTSQLATAAKISVTYKAKSTLHKKCRQSENDLYVENVACHKEWLSRKQIKELKCKAYSDVSLRVGNQNSNKQIVTKGGSEIIEAYVKRVTSTICGLPGGGGMVVTERQDFWMIFSTQRRHARRPQGNSTRKTRNARNSTRIGRTRRRSATISKMQWMILLARLLLAPRTHARVMQSATPAKRKPMTTWRRW